MTLTNGGLSGTFIAMQSNNATLTLADGGNTATVEYFDSLTFTGGSGADIITFIGDDGTIDAGAGNDVITAALGGDIITGGAGSDTFKYTAVLDSQDNDGDTITDFDATDDNEKIDLNGFTAGGFVFLGNEAQAFSGGSDNAEARFNDTTKLLEIDADGDGNREMEITLTGVNLSDLDANDFTAT